MQTERISLPQAAALAGLDPSTLQRAAQRGTLQATREGPPGPRGVWWTTRGALELYLANRPAGTVARWARQRERA